MQGGGEPGDLVGADDQGRRDLQRAAPQATGQHAPLAQRGDHRSDQSAVGQLDGGQHARPSPDLGHRRELGQRLQRAGEQHLELERPLGQAFALGDVQGDKSRGSGDRVT